MSVRAIRISKEELLEIRKIYEGVMSYACYGLFYREGEVLGREMAKIAMKSSGGDKDKYFEVVANLVAGRGWVEKAEFSEDKVVTRGSIEVEEGKDMPTCHILKGIIKSIYEQFYNEGFSCEETECESKGDEHCVFTVKRKGV
jgi:predicted hydrocarbon binding protein